ncbi:hypothetical protein CEUSTIGMA_g1293.t1 [Chlamydomonas eustigma]|uniref:Uncharacterized protein n=1 Tax=Chlamydomonas eustigma TaxID=1157962 RepID=A0A250WSP2_9CHLO|nr:hypothetical protein CEUSTIGMA_g1293.t1 [Chlamydomonas eustigma]|eukprot:GAX73843.1 hypothetical protein CEUSTIGMA_g1293.t1 [Chlamydomonas eustigma]
MDLSVSVHNCFKLQSSISTLINFVIGLRNGSDYGGIGCCHKCTSINRRQWDHSPFLSRKELRWSLVYIADYCHAHYFHQRGMPLLLSHPNPFYFSWDFFISDAEWVFCWQFVQQRIFPQKILHWDGFNILPRSGNCQVTLTCGMLYCWKVIEPPI